MKVISVVVSCAVVIILTAAVLIPVVNDADESGENTLDVIVLGGQSNAAYNTLRVTPTEVNGSVPLASTGCFYYGTTSQAVQYGVTPLSDCAMRPMIEGDAWRIGGEEPAIAKAVSDKTNDDVYVINVAIGGRNIHNFTPGESGGQWIDEVLTDALSHIPGGYTVKMCGWVWIQGESDQTTPVADYIADFEKIEANFRSYGLDECYLVKTKASDSGNATAAHNELIRSGAVVLGSNAPNSFTVANGGLKAGDTLHYSQEGRNIVGTDVGHAMAQSLPTHIRENVGQSLISVIPTLIIVAIIVGVASVALRSRD